MLLSTYLFLRTDFFFENSPATNQIKQFRQKSYKVENYLINYSVKIIFYYPL